MGCNKHKNTLKLPDKFIELYTITFFKEGQTCSQLLKMHLASSFLP